MAADAAVNPVDWQRKHMVAVKNYGFYVLPACGYALACQNPVVWRVRLSSALSDGRWRCDEHAEDELVHGCVVALAPARLMTWWTAGSDV